MKEQLLTINAEINLRAGALSGRDDGTTFFHLKNVGHFYTADFLQAHTALPILLSAIYYLLFFRLIIF